MADIPAPPPGFTLDAAPPPPPPPPGFKLAAPPPPPGFKLDAAAAGGPTAPGGFKLEVREPTLPDQIRSFADTYLTPSTDRPPIKTAGDLAKAFGSDLTDVGKTLTKPMVKGVADLFDYAHGGLEPGKDISDEAKAALSMFASKAPGKVPVAGAEAAAEAPKPAAEAPPTGGQSAPPAVEPGESSVAKARNAAATTDDDLYRLRTNSTADKIEWQDYINNLPDEVKSAPLMEKLFHYGEDPEMVKLTPEEKAVWDKYVAPLKARETKAVTRLQELGVPIKLITGGEGGPNYMHRIVKGNGSMFDALDPSGINRPRDPVIGTGRSLAKRPPSSRARTMEGTVSEIEAGTDVRYHKNAIVNTAYNIQRMEAAIRNIETINKLLERSVSKGLAQRTRGNQPVPQGWRETGIPQLTGWSFDPKTANVLESFYHGNPVDKVLAPMAAANRYLVGSLFLSPIGHIQNVLTDWVVGRGWANFTPKGWLSIAKNGALAMRDVLTKSPEYIAMLRQGAGMQYGGVYTKNFYDTMLKAMGGDLQRNPRTLLSIAKSIAMSPVNFMKAWYSVSQKAMWLVNDMAMMQRYRELMEAGLKPQQAIAEAEKHIANYRIPPEIMRSRFLSNIMGSRALFNFGPYHYARMSSIGRMVGDLVKGTAAERTEAAGQIATAAILLTVGLPLADKAVRAITGNKNASVPRPGVLKLPEDAIEMTKGEKDLTSTLEAIIAPSPASEMLPEALYNRQMPAYLGRVYDPYHGPGRAIAEATDWAAGQAAPVGWVQEMLKGFKSPGQIVSEQATGVRLPTDQQVARRKAALAGLTGKHAKPDIAQEEIKWRKLEDAYSPSRNKDKVERWLKDTLGVP